MAGTSIRATPKRDSKGHGSGTNYCSFTFFGSNPVTVWIPNRIPTMKPSSLRWPFICPLAQVTIIPTWRIEFHKLSMTPIHNYRDMNQAITLNIITGYYISPNIITLNITNHNGSPTLNIITGYEPGLGHPWWTHPPSSTIPLFEWPGFRGLGSHRWIPIWRFMMENLMEKWMI